MGFTGGRGSLIVPSIIDGRYYPAAMVTGETQQTFPTQDRLYGTQRVIYQTCRADRASAEVTLGGTPGNVIRWGLYDDQGGVPGNLIAEFAPIDGTVVAVTDLVIALNLAPGIYYDAFVSQVASPSCNLRAYNAGRNPQIGQANNASASVISHTRDGVNGNLPAVFAPTGTSALAWRMYLRLRNP